MVACSVGGAASLSDGGDEGDEGDDDGGECVIAKSEQTTNKTVKGHVTRFGLQPGAKRFNVPLVGFLVPEHSHGGLSKPHGRPTFKDLPQYDMDSIRALGYEVSGESKSQEKL